ncbi:MAG: peroxiredoxin family protein [Firmicutes bacterium]|nr:peroxiredoxin family protein [Bacillota bacterium]
MSRLRARTNGILFAITVILALIFLAIRFFSDNSYTPGQMKPVLAIMDERQDPSWSEANAGPALGARVPVMSGVTVNGRRGEIDFGDGGKRKILFLMPDPDICPDCHASARKLAEYWSRRHGDRLAFYLLYKGLPPVVAPAMSSEDKSDFPLIVVGGVAPYLDALRTLTARVFFVSEKGRIEYFMDMPTPWRWLACDEAIEHFAAQGKLPQSLPVPRWVYVGRPLPGMDLRKLDGTPFRLAEETKGRVAVLYATSLGCKPCESLYPVVRSLHDSFGDLVKQYLIYGDPINDEIAEKEVRRFKESVGYLPYLSQTNDIRKTNREQDLKQIHKIAKQCHVEALIASYDDITNSWPSPSCVIIDRNGIVTAKYMLGSCIGAECYRAESELKIVLQKILNK